MNIPLGEYRLDMTATDPNGGPVPVQFANGSTSDVKFTPSDTSPNGIDGPIIDILAGSS